MELNSAGQSPTLLVYKTVHERLPSHGSSAVWCLPYTRRMNLVVAMLMIESQVSLFVVVLVLVHMVDFHQVIWKEIQSTVGTLSRFAF